MIVFLTPSLFLSDVHTLFPWKRFNLVLYYRGILLRVKSQLGYKYGTEKRNYRHIFGHILGEFHCGNGILPQLCVPPLFFLM